MVGSINLSAETEWLSIENEINILGIRFTTRFADTVEKNWTSVLLKFQRALWMNNVRMLNIIQKVILLNTYISSKMWYVASVLPLPNKFAGKFISRMGSFLWHGRNSTRVPFETLILPKERGGLNLHSPAIKAKALIVNRMVHLAEELPYFYSFYQMNANPPFIQSVPIKFGHIRTVLQETAFIPEPLREAPSSKSLYQFFIQRLKDAKIVENHQQRDWKAVLRNLHSKNLSSNQRSTWYLIMHRKIITNELLHSQQRRTDPYCDHCAVEIEDVIHKIFKCGINRRIWYHQRELLCRMDNRLRRYEIEQWLYPTFKQCTRDQKNMYLKTIATFLYYVTTTPIDERSVQHYEFYKSCN